jgi:phosphate transport system substrate-binding protein
MQWLVGRGGVKQQSWAYPGRTLAGLLFCAAAVAAIAAQDRSPAPDDLKGELTIVGSRSMHEIVDNWVRLYRREHPSVIVRTALYGSGTAAGALVEEMADIAPLSREMRPEERADFDTKPFAPTAVRVGTGSFATKGYTSSLAVFVHRDNPIEGIAVQQLAAILKGEISQGWRAIDRRTNLSACPIRLYGIEWSAGTRWFLESRILNGHGIRERVAGARDGSAEAARWGADLCALGFGSPGDAPPQTRILAVSALLDDEQVMPSEKTVASGEYPLTRSIYLYFNRPADRSLSPEAEAFLRMALSKDGQAQIAATPYFPLTRKLASEQLAALP